MLSDIEIASAAKMLPIDQIAQSLGVLPEELEPYGRYKAKLAESIYKRLADRENGKLILVTAINPTPAGEGKTTTTVGLGEAMPRIGKKPHRMKQKTRRKFADDKKRIQNNAEKESPSFYRIN